MASLYCQETLQQVSENFHENNLLLDRNEKSIGNSNLTQNTENKDDVFEKVPYIANTLFVKTESIKEEDDIEIKEEKDMKHETHLSLKCEGCPDETRDIELHLKGHQSKEEILTCSECYYLTTCSDSLKKHMETHEAKTETFKCQKCDYVTRSHGNLTTHMLVHQENYNFSCDKCSYQAKTRSSLISHKLIHLGKDIFPCDICNYRSKKKSNLVRHMLAHKRMLSKEKTCKN